MTSSLVGSEMCIRDSSRETGLHAPSAAAPASEIVEAAPELTAQSPASDVVSRFAPAEQPEHVAPRATTMATCSSLWEVLDAAVVIEALPTLFCRSGETGRGYRSLYSDYLNDASTILLQSPYLHTHRGMNRLQLFLRELEAFPGVSTIVVFTDSTGDSPQSRQW
eukprot:3456097-Prorocentrum_lima.AAC.1